MCKFFNKKEAAISGFFFIWENTQVFTLQHSQA
jgi:hypothetical protein